MSVTVQKIVARLIVPALLIAAFAAAARPLLAQPEQAPQVAQPGQPESRSERAVVQEGAGGEANLRLPDLSVVDFRGINGRTLLMGGLVICGLGLLFGLGVFTQTKNLTVHPVMLDVSELIY